MFTQAEDEVASFANEALSGLEKRPRTQQIAIGVLSGLATGYIFAKIGKTVALVVGVAAIGLQCCSGSRRFSINWKKVENDARDVLQQSSKFESSVNRGSNKVMNMFKDNTVFFGSFGGGFLVGVSFS